MSQHIVCVTNNPLILERYKSSDRAELRLVEGASTDVFRVARDLIHAGWKFLNHPQYGNFKPSKQPYRTLALEASESDLAPVDMDSFSMLENALDDRQEPLVPEACSETTRHDFAVIDAELMKETLNRFYKKSIPLF